MEVEREVWAKKELNMGVFRDGAYGIGEVGDVEGLVKGKGAGSNFYDSENSADGSGATLMAGGWRTD